MNENLYSPHKILCKTARYKKPYTIGELFNFSIAVEIVETMLDTIASRIGDRAEDDQDQNFGKLSNKLFSFQLAYV